MKLAQRIVIILLGSYLLFQIYGIGADVARLGGIENYMETRRKTAELKEAMGLINALYVEESSAAMDVLTESAFEGLTSKLDPYSEYLDFKNMKRLEEETRQEFGGIGVTVEMRDQSLTVVAPLEGSPGERAGLLRGDRIVSVDGESIEGLSISESVARLKGKPGTQVAMRIERDGQEEAFEVTVVRELIEVDNVLSEKMLEAGIGYLRIAQFGRRTGEELEEAIDGLLDQGMRALVIDLRNNPGGLLETAIEVVDKFVPAGKLIAYTKGRHPSMTEEWYSTDVGASYDFPLVALVNPGSASASEIVAGALKDLDRAKLVGDKTFGKGSVQSILPLSDRTGLKLTTARYYTPGGYVIHEKGVEPDVKIEISPGEESNLYVQRSRLETMPRSEFVERFGFEPIEDKQLEAAKAILREALSEAP